MIVRESSQKGGSPVRLQRIERGKIAKYKQLFTGRRWLFSGWRGNLPVMGRKNQGGSCSLSSVKSPRWLLLW